MDNDKKRHNHKCEVCGQTWRGAKGAFTVNCPNCGISGYGLVEGEAAPAPQAATPEETVDYWKRKYAEVYRMWADNTDSQAEAPRPSAPNREGLCEDCGSEYPTPWFAANDVWNRVVEHSSDPKNFLCMHCFVRRAETVIRCTGWELVPENRVAESRPSAEEVEPPDSIPTVISAEAWESAMTIMQEVEKLHLGAGFVRREGYSKSTKIAAQMVQLSINKFLHRMQERITRP